ncbi:hypothetical protein [Hyphococcus sp. DH-69]|uniref:hypothetical protein n=1 Tax=Hyphococcus formosus TaxID=3143534 RepID=UPI00398A73B3
MERPNTVSALEAKRAQLIKELKLAKKAVKAIRIDLQHVEAATRLFTDNTPRAIPRRDVQFRAERGEMLRHVLNSFRTAKEPLTSHIIAEAWCKERGLKADHETYVLMRKRVGACLNKLKKRGTIKHIATEGLHKHWVLCKER